MPQHLLYLHNAEINSTMANIVQVMSMCSAWIQAGYRVTLVLRCKQPSDAQIIQKLKSAHDAPEALTIKLLISKLPTKIQKHYAAFKIPAIIRSIKPDFCFVRDPGFFHAALKTGIPVIMELHNTRLHLGSTKLNNHFQRRVIQGSKSSRCLQVIAISAALADYWQKQGISKEKILVLHDGFTAEHFTEPQNRNNIRQRYGLPLDKPVVVYTGNLQENRGIEYMIALAVKNPDILFFAAGGSQDRIIHYRNLCQSQSINNLEFPGRLPHFEIPALLAAADVLLAVWSNKVPTIDVCSPLKVFEYMASGIPAVYPGYPTILEVITDTLNGFLAVPDDPESLHLTLHKALSLNKEERQQYHIRSRKIAFDHYTWDSRVGEIIGSLPRNLRNP